MEDCKSMDTSIVESLYANHPDSNYLGDMTDSQRELVREKNKMYWEKYNTLASQVYLDQLQKLEQIILSNKGQESVIKRDDSFLGQPAPNHRMYKFGDTLVSEDGCRGYEFLIEYDIYEPTVGIYFGCKGLILKGDTDQQIFEFNQEWEQIRGNVVSALNNTFPKKDFTNRFKLTNNANDNTYWPFWISLHEDEDIVQLGTRAVMIIKRVYEQFLGKELKFQNTCDCIPQLLSNEKIETAFTFNAYNKLSKKLKTEDNKQLFEKFMHMLLREKKLSPNPIFEKAYEVQYANTDFAYHLVAFFELVFPENKATKKTGVPWETIYKVFLKEDGTVYGNSVLKVSYSRNNDSEVPSYKHKRMKDEASDYIKKILE